MIRDSLEAIKKIALINRAADSGYNDIAAIVDSLLYHTSSEGIRAARGED